MEWSSEQSRMSHGSATGCEGGRRPVFVFSGQGAQWAGMGRELLERSTVFEMVLRACDVQVRRWLGWSLLDVVSARQAPLGNIEVSCPAIVAMELALAALWRSWGVEPAAVVGHSIGEVAAAHVAGVLTLEDAMRVICQQGRVMGRLRGRGAMAVVGLPWERAAQPVPGAGGPLWRAVHASPEWTVMAGEPEVLTRALAAWRQQGVVARWVDSEVAAHCPPVEPFAAPLRERLEGLHARTARVPMFSTVTGQDVAGRRLDAEHWVRNLTDPVLFSDAAHGLISRGHTVFLEVSPHPLLKHWLESCLEHAGQAGTVLASLRRGRDSTPELLRTLRHLSGEAPRERGTPFPEEGSSL